MVTLRSSFEYYMNFPGRFFERGAGVHNSLMDPYDKLPCPDSPKLQVALEVCLALEVVLKINNTFTVLSLISLLSMSMGLPTCPPSSSHMVSQEQIWVGRCLTSTTVGIFWTSLGSICTGIDPEGSGYQ